MATRIEFEVLGEAKPQGSKRGFVVRRRDGSHGVAMAESSRDVKSWRQQVAAVAFATMLGRPAIIGPVRVELHFFRARPKGHYGSGKNATAIKGSAPPHPISKPDVDKLSRAVCDALTGIVWRDDSQVIQLVACKHWGEPARCEVIVVDATTQEQRGAA